MRSILGGIGGENVEFQRRRRSTVEELVGDKRLRGQIKKVWVLSLVESERSVLVHLGLLAVLGHRPSSISRLVKSLEVHSLPRGWETSPCTLMRNEAHLQLACKKEKGDY